MALPPSQAINKRDGNSGARNQYPFISQLLADRERRVSEFGRRIRPYVAREILAAYQAEKQGQPDMAFSHLERAHILGQTSTVEHVRVHWHMFLWGIRQRNIGECLGQLLRIAGAAIGTTVGLVPQGNTGGTNVKPFQPMPIPPDLAALIEEARTSKK